MHGEVEGLEDFFLVAVEEEEDMDMVVTDMAMVLVVEEVTTEGVVG